MSKVPSSFLTMGRVVKSAVPDFINLNKDANSALDACNADSQRAEMKSSGAMLSKVALAGGIALSASTQAMAGVLETANAAATTPITALDVSDVTWIGGLLLVAGVSIWAIKRGLRMIGV